MPPDPAEETLITPKGSLVATAANAQQAESESGEQADSSDGEAQPLLDTKTYDEDEMHRRQRVLDAASAVFIASSLQASSSAATTLYAKRKLHASPAEITVLFSTFGFCQMLPYCFKPVYGFLLDNFPIAGERRRPYMVLGQAGVVLQFLLMAFWCDTVAQLTWIMFAGNILGVLPNLGAQSLIVDYSLGKRLGTDGSSELWAEANVNKHVGSFVGSVLGVVLIQAGMPYHLIFLVNAIPQAVVTIYLFAIGRVEDECPEVAALEALSEWRETVSLYFAEPMVWRVIVGLLILYAAPVLGSTMSGPTFLFFNDDSGLALSDTVCGVLVSVNSIGGIFAAWLFKNYFVKVDIRRTIFIAVYAQVAVGAFAIPLFLGWTKGSAMASTIFATIFTLAISIAGSLWQISWYVAAEQSCPPGASVSTIFGILTSLSNIVLLGSIILNQQLQAASGVTDHNFNGIWVVLLCSLAAQVVCVQFCWLLPERMEVIRERLFSNAVACLEAKSHSSYSGTGAGLSSSSHLASSSETVSASKAQ